METKTWCTGCNIIIFNPHLLLCQGASLWPRLFQQEASRRSNQPLAKLRPRALRPTGGAGVLPLDGTGAAAAAGGGGQAARQGGGARGGAVAGWACGQLAAAAFVGLLEDLVHPVDLLLYQLFMIPRQAGRQDEG